MKKLAVLISVLFLTPCLSACWDYREVDNMSIVVGFAIDKGTSSKYLVTYELVDMTQVQSGGKVKSVLVESEGDTLLEAARNAIRKNYPKLYFGHTVTVLICQNIAREGVLEVLDFIYRDAETRASIHLFVSEEETAGELLKTKPLKAELLAAEIDNILSEQKYLAKAIPIQTYEFVNSVAEEGISSIMTAVCIESNEENKVISICGSAIFKGEKLLGFIDDEETKMLSFILDKVEGGVIIAKTADGENEGRFSLEIIKSNTKMKPVLKDDKLSIEIDIETSVALDEHISKKDYCTVEGLKELSKIAEMQLEKEIEVFINKIKTEFGSDVFGFGNSIYKKHPKKWKEIKDNWDEEFKNIEVSVKAKIDIVNTGILGTSIESRE